VKDSTLFVTGTIIINIGIKFVTVILGNMSNLKCMRFHLCLISRDAIVGPSAVWAQPWPLQRLLGFDLSHTVHWCVIHCRHNAGDRSTEVGHAINLVTTYRHSVSTLFLNHEMLNCKSAMPIAYLVHLCVTHLLLSSRLNLEERRQPVCSGTHWGGGVI